MTDEIKRKIENYVGYLICEGISIDLIVAQLCYRYNITKDVAYDIVNEVAHLKQIES